MKGRSIVVIAVFVAAIVLVLMLNQSGRQGGPYAHPDATNETGTRAWRELLERHSRGVDLNELHADTDVAILIDSDADIDGIDTFVNRGGHVVVLHTEHRFIRDSSGTILSFFPTAPVERACEIDAFDGLEAPAQAVPVLELGTALDHQQSCFFFAADTFGASDAVALPMVITGSWQGGTLTVLGSAHPFTNAELVHGDHAALSLAIVGADPDQRISMVYGPRDVVTESETVIDLLPDRFFVAFIVALLASLMWVWARSRRFGPLAVDPAIVQIPASLIVSAEAELHRRAKRHDWAQRVICEDVGHRVRRAYQLGPDVTAEFAAHTVAERSGIPVERVYAVLTGGFPASDTGLESLLEAVDELNERALVPVLSPTMPPITRSDD